MTALNPATIVLAHPSAVMVSCEPQKFPVALNHWLTLRVGCSQGIGSCTPPPPGATIGQSPCDTEHSWFIRSLSRMGSCRLCSRHVL